MEWEQNPKLIFSTTGLADECKPRWERKGRGNSGARRTGAGNKGYVSETNFSGDVRQRNHGSYGSAGWDGPWGEEGW